MPLSSPAPRKHIHTRSIDYKSFQREDGLWDIEGHMTDTKTYAMENRWRGDMPAGTPVHQMWIRITIDTDYVIHDVEAATDDSPFPLCPNIAPNYKELIGIRMGAGWRKAIRQRVGGTAGCTHLTELLFPMATVAMQTLLPLNKSDTGEDADKRPMVLDTCHAWASDSPVVKVSAPKFYTGSD